MFFEWVQMRLGYVFNAEAAYMCLMKGRTIEESEDALTKPNGLEAWRFKGYFEEESEDAMNFSPMRKIGVTFKKMKEEILGTSPRMTKNETWLCTF